MSATRRCCAGLATVSRVGRNASAVFCILLDDDKINEVADADMVECCERVTHFHEGKQQHHVNEADCDVSHLSHACTNMRETAALVQYRCVRHPIYPDYQPRTIYLSFGIFADASARHAGGRPKREFCHTVRTFSSSLL